MSRRFLCLRDLGEGGIVDILDQSAMFERLRGTAEHPRPLVGRTVALMFDKPSTRTRVSLEVAVYELGGHPMVLTSNGSQIARGEPAADTARVLERYVHGITYRTFAGERLQEMARACALPILNALTDEAHPMQLCADLYTVRKARGSLAGLKFAWIGDGNNMARSWIEAAELLKLELVVACPEGFEPPVAEIERACKGGAKVSLVRDPAIACNGADVISTDVWASMGQEDEASLRKRAFAGFRLTAPLVALGASNAIVLHCLPAHRGEEIDADVLEGGQSLVWDQAEARLHTAKALLAWAFGA